MSIHGKHAVSFRDLSLLEIFKTSISMLQQINAGQVSATPDEVKFMTNSALDF